MPGVLPSLRSQRLVSAGQGLRPPITAIGHGKVLRPVLGSLKCRLNQLEATAAPFGWPLPYSPVFEALKSILARDPVLLCSTVPYRNGSTKQVETVSGSRIPSAHGSLISEASGTRSAEVNERRRREEGTARRRRGTCLPHLRAIRRSRMLTQERLSVLSGVGRETIYRLEGGRRGAMPDTLWKLALALRVSPEDLIYGHPWW